MIGIRKLSYDILQSEIGSGTPAKQSEMISTQIELTKERSISQKELNNEVQDKIIDIIKDKYFETRIPKTNIVSTTDTRYTDIQKMMDFGPTRIRNTTAFETTGLADVFNSSNIQVVQTGKRGGAATDHLRGFQEVQFCKSDGFKMTVNKTIEEIMFKTDTNIGIQELNNAVRVVNSEMNFSLMQKFSTGMTFNWAGLQTSSFSTPLITLMAIAEQTGLNYFGGLEKTYFSTSMVCPRIAITNSVAQPHIFPITTNQVGGVINCFAVTAAQIAYQGVRWAGPGKIIYLRKTDVQENGLNNVWTAMHMEHPFCDRKYLASTSTDVNQTPISTFTCENYANTTFISGEKTTVIFVIADEWDPQKNYDVFVGLGVLGVSTIANNPYLNPLAPLAVPCTAIAASLTNWKYIELAYLRWCKYYGNEYDIRRCKAIATLLFHKFYLVSSQMITTSTLTGGTNTVGCGVDDLYSIYPPAQAVISLDLLNTPWQGGMCGVSVTVNKFMVDLAYTGMGGNVDQVWPTYYLPDSQDEMLFAGAAGWLVGVGMKTRAINLYGELNEVLILTNKLALGMDLFRCIENKPSVYELMGSTTADPFYIQQQKDQLPLFFQTMINVLFEVEPMTEIIRDPNTVIQMGLNWISDGANTTSCISSWGIATNQIPEYSTIFSDGDEDIINSNQFKFPGGVDKYYIDYPNLKDSALTINNYEVDNIMQNYVKRIPFQKAYSMGAVTVNISSGGINVDTEISFARYNALAADGLMYGYYNFIPIMSRCWRNTRFAMMVKVTDVQMVMSCDITSYCYIPQVHKFNKLNINEMKMKDNPIFSKMGKIQEKKVPA